MALEVSHETGYVDTLGGAARLRRRMVERVLTHCETDRKAAEPLLILLRRFATESAREEARMFCDELVADEAHRSARARSDRGVSEALSNTSQLSSLRTQGPITTVRLIDYAKVVDQRAFTLDEAAAYGSLRSQGRRVRDVASYSAGTMLGARIASRCSGRSRLTLTRNSSATPRSCLLSSLAIAAVSSLVRSRTIA